MKLKIYFFFNNTTFFYNNGEFFVNINAAVKKVHEASQLFFSCALNALLII